MKKLLVLETNSNIANKEVIAAAKKKGIYTIVVGHTPEERSAVKRLADESWLISTADYEPLLEAARAAGVDGVFGGTDYAVDVALRLAGDLGLPYYCSKDAWHYSRNKADFKSRCIEFGVPVVPEYPMGDGTQIEYPVVVKPCDRSGNVGISFCYNDDELREAVGFAREKAENGELLIEKYLTGMEYTPFYVLSDGEPRLLYLSSMLHEEGMPTNCCAISTTVVGGAALEKYLKEVDPHVRDLLKGIGCRDGVAWLELMTDEAGDYYAIEMGHRLSGEMLWMSMPEARGFSPLEWMVNYAVEGKNDKGLLPEPFSSSVTKNGCGYILWTKAGGTVGSIFGLEEVKETLNANVHAVANVGAQIDANQYALIISFASSSREALCSNIKLINNLVSMKDDAGNEMLSYFTGFDRLQNM